MAKVKRLVKGEKKMIEMWDEYTSEFERLRDEYRSLTLVSSPQYDCMPSDASESDLTASQALSRATLREGMTNALARRNEALRTLKRLSHEEQHVLFKFYVRHMTLSEIAKDMDVTLDMVKKTRWRALELLRK